MKLRFSKNLNAIGFNEPKLIHGIFNQSSMRKSHFFESRKKSRKISSVELKTKKGQYTQRDREAVALYI